MERELNYIFSSDPANGAFNVNVLGSAFSIQLYEPITIPMSAKYCVVGVQGANIWNTVPNISEDLDNNVFFFSDGINPNIQVTIAKGQYDLVALQNAIYTAIDSNSDGNVPPAAYPAKDMFVFSPDNASQKVVVTFLKENISILWATSTLRTILGFEAGSPTAPPPPITGKSLIAPNVARFNQITSFLIRTDLINTGIPVNANATGVLANVFIDVLPSSLINFTPFNIVWSDASNIIGARITTINFSLANQENQLVDTNSEYWNFTLIFKYYIDNY